jgi:AraC family transcriptional activator of pobA
LLQRSHQTLDQIADYLGFRSTPQFSTFFKSETGLPPGAFRKASRQQGSAAQHVQVGSYADWP